MVNLSSGVNKVWYNIFLEKYNTSDTKIHNSVEPTHITEIGKSIVNTKIDDYLELKNNHRKKIFGLMDSKD
jgi:hypothetical protein